jgi:hypothetical protein
MQHVKEEKNPKRPVSGSPVPFRFETAFHQPVQQQNNLEHGGGKYGYRETGCNGNQGIEIHLFMYLLSG